MWAKCSETLVYLYVCPQNEVSEKKNFVLYFRCVYTSIWFLKKLPRFFSCRTLQYRAKTIQIWIKNSQMIWKNILIFYICNKIRSWKGVYAMLFKTVQKLGIKKPLKSSFLIQAKTAQYLGQNFSKSVRKL